MPQHPAPGTILIVEPDAYRRQCHCVELSRASDFTVLAAVGGRREALEFLAHETVDFIVTNSMLSDGSPADVIRRALKTNPRCLTLAVSACRDAHIVMHTIACGADGYVLFSDASTTLVSSLRVLQAGGSPVSPTVARTVLLSLQSRKTAQLRDGGRHPLSARELDVLRLLSQGIPLARIARTLGLSKSTVSTHARNIYRKFGAHSRYEAINRAREMDLL